MTRSAEPNGAGTSPAIAALLLDIDGTLLLSNDAHARAWCDAFSEFGYDVRFEQVRPLIGMGGDKLVAAVTPGLSIDEGLGKAVAERRKTVFLERYLSTVAPAPGGRALLERLRDEGVGRIVATSATSSELQALLQAANIADLIEEQATTDDASSSKPDPDIVEAALRRGKVVARNAMLLGDTPYDIEAARRAHVATIAVRCGGWSDAKLGGAVAIYDDPADFLRHYDISPLRVAGA